MSPTADIVWLRDDFRLGDQPSVHAAADRPALFVYVDDEKGGGARPLGGAAKWRLAESLTALESELSALGARLEIVKGDAEETILALATAAKASRVVWTRRCEGGAKALDERVERALKARGVEALTFSGRLMREPSELSKSDGSPFAIFTAFLRRHRVLGPLPAPTPAPKSLTTAPWPHDAPQRVSIDALKLRPTKPDWSGELSLGETPGEAGALAALQTFAAETLRSYVNERDMLAPGAASRLSANLRFGEISPRRIAHAVETAAAARPAVAVAAGKYLAELAWRDFATTLLDAYPDLATRPLRPEFELFPWRDESPVFTPGRMAKPAIRSSTRDCANYGGRGTCPIARG